MVGGQLTLLSIFLILFYLSSRYISYDLRKARLNSSTNPVESPAIVYTVKLGIKKDHVDNCYYLNKINIKSLLVNNTVAGQDSGSPKVAEFCPATDLLTIWITLCFVALIY